jgi:hypothetical protein
MASEYRSNCARHFDSQYDLKKSRGNIQMVSKYSHLFGFQFFPISALKIKREMPMPFLIPPVLVGKIG